MFMDGVDEFLKSFMEKINHVVTTEGKDLNVSENANKMQRTSGLCFHLFFFSLLFSENN